MTGSTFSRTVVAGLHGFGTPASASGRGTGAFARRFSPRSPVGSRRSGGVAASVVLLGCALAGCGGAGAENGEDSGRNPGTPPDGAELTSDRSFAARMPGSDSGFELEDWTPGGARVVLAPATGRPRAGRVRFEIWIDPAPPEPLDVTVDLFAPRMPAHGIVRFPVRPGADGGYTADLEIPMEGRWQIYVNLDIGHESAVFEIDVDPAPGRSGSAQDDVHGTAHGVAADTIGHAGHHEHL